MLCERTALSEKKKAEVYAEAFSSACVSTGRVNFIEIMFPLNKQ